ncbi:hypothetical protein F7725_020569 [Dissostichus mawsoni]|uniref:Phospholipase A2-like central domain-containing protein n=1 Tax=Dissostichus mawsoni TaxID=36200 RepID=A0A7J5YEX8_DISMA|nr:hypothetical protein F7725_020569 [Dissostichus mawsoni]
MLESAEKPRGAVSVTRGAESAARLIMWSVFFVFLSYLDRNFVKGDFLSRALDAERESKEMFSMLNGTFCAKMSTVRESFLYQVSDGAEVVRSFVSPAGKLVNCSVTVNQMQVKSFMHECRLGLKEQRAGQQLETRFARMNEAKLMCREFKERSERSGRERGDDSALQDQVLKRSKRGFTYPGTLWCGAGNMADNYDQLGDFAETDSCCRIHDHCPHVIHSFSANYGHTNFKWHSICHCDCDNELKACLRNVNDTSSRVVGQAFFNVIGVPCFELAYEEQCAERHWYGIEEEEKPESTTQSTISGPEEPSLTNVVTAAEDFIKVLATVSTSQSSTDPDKDETQNSEKKKRKKIGKKKKTNKKRKGKGRERKQKAEEGAAVSPSGCKAEEVIALSNFLSESHKQEPSIGNTNRLSDSEYKLGGKEEPYNEVMKDEPAMQKQTVSITPPTPVQKKPAESREENTLSTPTTAIPHEVTRRPRKGRRKKNKKKTLLPLKSFHHFYPHHHYHNPTEQPKQQSFLCPIEIPKVKRNRSKERRDREGRKKRRKVSLASPFVDAGYENSSTDNLKVIPFTGAPTVPSLPTTERQVSQTIDVMEGRRSSNESPAAPAIPLTTAAINRPAEHTETQSEWRLFTTITAAPSIITNRHRQRIRQQRKPRKKHSGFVTPSAVAEILPVSLTVALMWVLASRSSCLRPSVRAVTANLVEL